MSANGAGSATDAGGAAPQYDQHTMETLKEGEALFKSQSTSFQDAIDFLSKTAADTELSPGAQTTIQAFFQHWVETSRKVAQTVRDVFQAMREINRR